MLPNKKCSNYNIQHVHKLCNGVSFFNNDFLRPVSQLGLKRNKILFQQDLPYFLHTFQTKKDNRFTILFQKNGKPLNQLKDFSDGLISGKSALRRFANHILLKPSKYAK